MHERLCNVLTKTTLKNAIKKASPLAQTSSLEGFHSVLNHFAPKMLAYSYRGMYCRYIALFLIITLYDDDSAVVVSQCAIL